MAIRIILVLLLMGGAISVLAQLGSSELMSTTYNLTEALKDPARTASDQHVQGLIRALDLHERLWRSVTYMGLVVFGLSASGFFVLSRRQRPSWAPSTIRMCPSQSWTTGNSLPTLRLVESLGDRQDHRLTFEPGDGAWPAGSCDNHRASGGLTPRLGLRPLDDWLDLHPTFRGAPGLQLTGKR